MQGLIKQSRGYPLFRLISCALLIFAVSAGVLHKIHESGAEHDPHGCYLCFHHDSFGSVVLTQAAVLPEVTAGFFPVVARDTEFFPQAGVSHARSRAPPLRSTITH